MRTMIIFTKILFSIKLQFLTAYKLLETFPYSLKEKRNLKSNKCTEGKSSSAFSVIPFSNRASLLDISQREHEAHVCYPKKTVIGRASNHHLKFISSPWFIFL